MLEWMRLLLALSVSALATCDRHEPPVRESPAAAISELAPAAAATTAATAASTTPPEVAPEPPPEPLLADIPRTQPPTLAEWKDAKKVTVTDAQFLDCISEQVREWVRVSCRERSIIGFPQSVTVVRGKGPDVLTFAKWYDNHSVASVQFRYGRGLALEALFVFADDSREVVPLKVEWPQSQPRAPAAVGRFVGVPHISADQHAQACGCVAAQLPDCTLGTIRASCLRLFDTGDCNAVIQCVLGQYPHPGYGKCGEGQVAHFSYCYRPCQSDGECPEGDTCAPAGDWGFDDKVCQ